MADLEREDPLSLVTQNKPMSVVSPNPKPINNVAVMSSEFLAAMATNEVDENNMVAMETSDKEHLINNDIDNSDITAKLPLAITKPNFAMATLGLTLPTMTLPTMALPTSNTTLPTSISTLPTSNANGNKKPKTPRVSGTSKTQFNEHMNGHFEHQCPHCDYTSRTEGRLKRHIKDFHTDDPDKMRREPGKPKLLRCRQCDFVATEKEDYWHHARTHIKDDKVLQCPKCPFVTEYKHHLEYHLRNHFGSKPFKCNKCNYSCVNKSMLNSHMKSHTNVYQYRCADCTYATKYCRSLKLHLQKYNHKPATVLNADGSLPTDGSGDFELVSKRGPPRGPRGPRKDGMPDDDSPPGFGPGMMMPPGLNGQSPLNGMMGYWSMLSQITNGLHPPPPLIPVSGINPLMPPNPHAQAPKELREGNKLDMTRPMQASPPMSMPLQATNTTPKKYRCTVCEFASDSRQILTDHMMRVHAAENRDLFNIFGIKSEQLEHMVTDHEPPTPKSEQNTPQRPHNGGATPQSSWTVMHPSALRPEMSPRQSQTSPRNGENRANMPVPANMSPNSRSEYNKSMVSSITSNIIAEAQQNGETPLDLTRADAENGDANENGAFSPSTKRKMTFQDEESNPEGGAQESGTNAPTPRKRSRKGKAFKLDVISMKLQEKRYSLSPTNEMEYDSEGEYMSDFASERAESNDDRLIMDDPTLNDDSRFESNNTKNAENGEDDDYIDYNNIHKNLSQLNGQDPHMDSSMPEESQPGKHEDSEVLAAQMLTAAMHARRILAEKQLENEKIDDPQTKIIQPEAPIEELPHVHSTQSEEDTLPKENEKNKYKCNFCSISFHDCILYTMHMGYHGFQDPFKCNMCGQETKNKVEFFVHIARAAHS